jgi:DNA-binding MarR family transcriptional regulator
MSAKRDDASGREQLERRALLATRALIDRMRTLYRELERATGAPIAVHRALASIESQPGIAASRLALALGMQRPALSHVLRGLVRQGWVERARSDADQRSVRIYLTDSGRQLLGATAGQAAGALQRAVRRLPSERLAGLAAGLEEMFLYLPVPTGEPAATTLARNPRGAHGARESKRARSRSATRAPR